MKDTRYITKLFSALSEQELEDCAQLYSTHYGKYSGEDKKHEKGQRIKMTPAWYKKEYTKIPDLYISMCYSVKNELLGHAIFYRKEIPNKGICSWVLQLVVNSQYRNRKIGKSLLQSAWGFSDYYAWGLATANAITLKTLESVTWREVSVSDMLDNLPVLHQIMNDIPYVSADNVILGDKISQVFSDFYPELEASNSSEELSVYTKRLGKIKPGYEWLAFTFASQEMIYTPERLESFMEFSELRLQEIYSRMDMPRQPWTRGTGNEVDYILNVCKVDSTSKILDMGCGQGRHSIELAKRGYNNIVGIDFSESNISAARQNSVESNARADFLVADARKYKTGLKNDLVLCLYDVLGSFREEKDNLAIVRSIKTNLAQGGYAVVSVMNMELTEAIAINVDSISKNPLALLKLPPSETMQISGNIFNPAYFVINTDDGLVYRKEQFTSPNEIFAEYVVADKRYKKYELEKLFESEGLQVIESRYVQAGHWDIPLTPTDSKAKEILLVVKG